ncbi:MAG: hypothetical protein JWM85_1743 [Acidimicrobiaceae bacterium]|nr:hypothetical protein [Acidimicrobiaceae bacterium]
MSGHPPPEPSGVPHHAGMTVLELSDVRRREMRSATNRRSLDRALGRLDSAEVVVVMNLDHFNHLDDSRGHQAGDRVTRSFGQTLTGALRTSDWAEGFGGEEFVVILNDASDPGSFLDRFRARWEGERPQSVTFSAGIAPVKGAPRLALAAADRALYRAKEAGRDCWAWAAEDDYKD